MKSAVPPTAKIAKDAKECVQECVSEFISFITSEAAEKCQMEKRKTIGGEDILYAMSMLGFENYEQTLKIHLAKLRQVCAFQMICCTCERFSPFSCSPPSICVLIPLFLDWRSELGID
jgi:nuclear transcription Y subunit beta